MTIKGAMIAASVAGMFAAGASGIASAKDAAKGGGDVMCDGINSCKGKGSCHGAGHSCAGQNACKGQGNTKTTKEDCLAKGGKVVGAEKDKK
jgi:uncharacterized membrane protein